MIQVCMGDKNMIDLDHLFHAQIRDTGSCIDQDIIIQQHGGGMRTTSYSTATPKNPELQSIYLNN